jgi:hypothetical protein
MAFGLPALGSESVSNQIRFFLFISSMAFSLSLNFWIFPLPVMGNSWTKAT